MKAEMGASYVLLPIRLPWPAGIPGFLGLFAVGWSDPAKKRNG